jgi:hypothetical protein
MYLDWPYYFTINSRGELIRPDSISIDFFPWFGVQKFNNLYDVSYPVVVTLHHDEALKGKGFTMNVALEANVRNNEAMNPSFNQSEYEPDVWADTSLFCDQLNSGNITFTVLDGRTDQPLADAQVMYTRGDLSCAVTTSSADGAVHSKMPICSGGYMTLLKEGYVNTYATLSTNLDENQELGSLVLEPRRERNVIIQKLPLIKQGGTWQFIPDQTRDITPYERAIIMLEKTDGTHHYAGVITSSTPGENQTIELVPGTYEVRIDVMSNQKLIIEPDERKKNGQTYYVPEERMVLDSHLSGGLRADNTTQYITIDKEQLDNSETIIFRVVGIQLADVPNLVVEDINKMNEVQALSQHYITTLQPVSS